MSLQENTRKTRYRLTVGQKKEICEFKKQHPHLKQQQIADVFKNRYPGLSIDRSTVSKVKMRQHSLLWMTVKKDFENVLSNIPC